MTEEEKAEESFNKHITENNCYFSKAEINIYKDGFLDGLAEGRKEEWHDLRKNPNDLPKEIEIYSVPVYVVSKHGSYDLAQYDYRHKLWYYKYTNEHILYEVIAWCELPKFKE